MILSGKRIEQALADGDIEIDPFDRELLNPASYDLRLGEEVLVYDRARCPGGVLDARDENPVRSEAIGPRGFVVRPGEGYLMHTLERTRTDVYVPVLDGKSSIGRLFVSVHQTAGYGDPGWDGQWTLEVKAEVFPVRLYPGMRIAQVRFHSVLGPIRKYAGNYVGARARGPVASRAWKQFHR